MGRRYMPKGRKSLDPFNRALKVFLEWGPAREVPVEERIRKVMGRATKKEIGELIKRFTEIQFAASAAVVDQLERKASKEDGRERVAAIEPRMSAENAATLYTQCRVSAWRDGYQ